MLHACRIIKCVTSTEARQPSSILLLWTCSASTPQIPGKHLARFRAHAAAAGAVVVDHSLLEVHDDDQGEAHLRKGSDQAQDLGKLSGMPGEEQGQQQQRNAAAEGCRGIYPGTPIVAVVPRVVDAAHVAVVPACARPWHA